MTASSRRARVRWLGPKGGRTACRRAPGRLSPFPRTGGDLDATASVRPRSRAREHTAYAGGLGPRRTIHDVALAGAAGNLGGIG